jgi:RNA polymerase sigma-70 factor (ECF subfamily)
MGFQKLLSVELTRRLKAWSDGDAVALDRLTPIVYAELHRLAQCNLAGERDGHLLRPSALVSEAFVGLIGGAPVEWASRTHFFAVSSGLAQQIFIDFARARDSGERGNRSPHVDPSGVKDLPRAAASPVDFNDLDAALEDLFGLDPRQAQVVELRDFGYPENAETAAALGISEPTMVRDWRMARAWLSRLQLAGTRSEEQPGTGRHPS